MQQMSRLIPRRRRHPNAAAWFARETLPLFISALPRALIKRAVLYRSKAPPKQTGTPNVRVVGFQAGDLRLAMLVLPFFYKSARQSFASFPFFVRFTDRPVENQIIAATLSELSRLLETVSPCPFVPALSRMEMAEDFGPEVERPHWWLSDDPELSERLAAGHESKIKLRGTGLDSYETVWSWLHKFHRAMFRTRRNRLKGTVEASIGGVCQSPQRGVKNGYARRRGGGPTN